MVNFKYFGLPLLVGLILGHKTSAEYQCKVESETHCQMTNNKDESKIIPGIYIPSEIIYNGDETSSSTDMKYIICTNPNPTSSTSCEIINSNNKEFPDIESIGYYKINDKYYSCPSKDENGTLYDSGQICIEIINPAKSCDNDNIGKLVKINNSYELCLAEYIADDIFKYPTLGFKNEQNESTHYLVKNIYSEDDEVVFKFNSIANYYTVNRSENSIIFDKKFTTPNVNGERCSDINTSKIIDRLEDFFSIDGVVGTGYYYTCNEGICGSSQQKQKNSNILEYNGIPCRYFNTSYNDGKPEKYYYQGNCNIKNILY